MSWGWIIVIISLGIVAAPFLIYLRSQRRSDAADIAAAREHAHSRPQQEDDEDRNW